MSSTHLSLHYHIVFSTKERRAIINDEWQPRLFAFLGGCIRALNGIPEAVGGTNDHVHLLVGLRATHRLADVVKEIKTASSRWIHTEIKSNLFSWQTGYGAFTVSVSNSEKVKTYILKQKEHHRKKSFRNEYVELLKLAQLDYDEQYLW
jgi:REP element-mobilizing transposase RayT